jgi:hypothetical protein
MTYSFDFDTKVLSVRETGKITIAAVSTRFGLGIATVTR